ncbi:recombinase family protein [Neobittarella massiliensis]|uniref:Recombinase family protein n=1 Tax=Neobittarella massiliensis (ex Bilen et al. 2018) TaxID=2041842 RepID=A0A8J6LU87_9FIRM|nr:recombinase family protein [Neobittarella massiliensis]MBC3516409.1 recombinase family protein [Neobittarella massiliensis]
MQKQQLEKTPQKIFYWAKYLRKSTDEDNSRSIHNQEMVLDGAMEEIVRWDTENEYIFSGTFWDEDYTGTDSERPQFKSLLRSLSNRQINMLLVTDLSRLSRNIAESIQYVQELFVALDIRFVSVQLPALDSFLEPDKVYSLEVPMQSMMNENHCAETSFKVRRTFNRLREQGQFIGAFAAYGWRKDPEDHHKLLLDKEPAQILQLMRDWVLEGSSASAVAKMLNERGIPNPSGYKAIKGLKFYPGCKNSTNLWSARTVHYLLTRPENIGTLIQGRYRVKSYKIHQQVKTPQEEWFVKEHAIPAIFTSEEQAAIAECLKRGTRISPGNPEKKVYLFSGFLTCPDCGKAIVRKSVKGYVYYICNTYKNYGVLGCIKHRIRHETLEKAVLVALQQQIALAVNKQEVIRRLDQAPPTHRQGECYDTMIKARNRDWEKIVRFKQGLYEDWKNGDLTKEEYHALKAKYTEREEKLQNTLRLLQEEKEQVGCTAKKGDSLISDYLKTGTVNILTREILVALVERIFVHEKGEITIRFRFADECQRVAAVRA